MRRFLPDVRGLPREFWFVWTGTLVNRLGGFVVPFLALYLTNVRKLPVEEAGVIVSLYGGGSIASGPVGGHLADRLGRRPALVLSTLLGGSAMLALGFIRSPSAIAPLVLLLGFFSELYRPVVSAIVADLVPPEDRPRAYGLQYWAVNLGFAIALVIAGFMSNRSFTLLFMADAATTFLFGALVWWNVPETRPAHDPVAHARAGGFLAPYRNMRFLAFAGFTLLVALVAFQSHMTLPVDMSAHGLSNEWYGTLLSMNGVIIVFVQPFASTYLQRFRRDHVLAAGALLYGLGFSLTGLANGIVPLYALSIVVWTLGEIVSAPITPTVVADLAPPSLRGAYQGAFQLVWGIASFTAPMIGSYLMGRFGAATLWSACLLAGIVSAAGYVTIALPRREAVVEAG